jgi:hypothetical protein
MRGVMANIAHLNERERSPIWKDDGWKKVSFEKLASPSLQVTKPFAMARLGCRLRSGRWTQDL